MQSAFNSFTGTVDIDRYQKEKYVIDIQKIKCLSNSSTSDVFPVFPYIYMYRLYIIYCIYY